MSYISKDFGCSACGTEIVGLTYKKSEIEEASKCPECGEQMSVLFLSVTPQINKEGGYGETKWNSSHFGKYREKAKLLVEKAKTPHNKRGDIEREIKKLEE